MKRNKNFENLSSHYLFLEIHKRKEEFLKKHSGIELLSLGVGDTTEPISPFVSKALVKIAEALGTPLGYVGYGPEQGIGSLRSLIAKKIYQGDLSADEIFISDGAKCDLGRLQTLFGGDVSIAVQDPSYPVYIDGSLLQGVSQVHRMVCLPENGFFPDLNALDSIDLIYFCSPNNPTGAVATKEQLKRLVAFAKEKGAILIFDAAYAAYIRSPHLPRSIYEIEGAKECAIEIGSFSKLSGFTGIRLGWTVVPEALRYDSGESVRKDWNRINTTLFNGASILAQQGGLAALESMGWKEGNRLIDFYLENAHLLKAAWEDMGYEVFGGVDAPYLWVRFPGQSSWDVFQKLLEKAHIVATPGSGFGFAGEGFMRFTAYAKRSHILQAIERLKRSFSRPFKKVALSV